MSKDPKDLTREQLEAEVTFWRDRYAAEREAALHERRHVARTKAQRKITAARRAASRARTDARRQLDGLPVDPQAAQHREEARKAVIDNSWGRPDPLAL